MQNGSLSSARHAILAQLVEQIGETCNFTMLHGGEVMYLDRVEAAWPLRMNLTSGSRVPLHCTASGKLLLAYLPKPSRDRMLGTLSYKSYTHSTIADRKSLDAELARIRKARYATDNEEFHAGLVCVAVPTRSPGGQPCAAIAVHAPMSRMPLERALEYLPLLAKGGAGDGSRPSFLIWYGDRSTFLGHQNQVRRLLRDHHRRRMRVAGNQRRHDRAIHHAQSCKTVHAQPIVDHGHRIAAHLAGAGRMEDRRAVVAREFEQVFVGLRAAARFVFFRDVGFHRFGCRERRASFTAATAQRRSRSVDR